MPQRIVDWMTGGSRPDTLRPVARWAMATVVTVAALCIAGLLDRVADYRTPFQPLYVALVIVASWAGPWPALASLVVGAVAYLTLWVAPRGLPWVADSSDQISTIGFAVTGLVIIGVCTLLRTARLRARRAESRLALAQEEVGVAVWEVDLSRGLVLASEQGWRMHGLAPRTGGGTLAEWAAPLNAEDRARIERRIAESTPATDRFEIEFRVDRPGGEARWLSARIHVHRDDGGRPVRTSGVSMDVTDARRMRDARAESERQLRLITDALPVLVAYIGPDHRYRFVNAAYEQWFGVPVGEITGRRIHEFVGETAFEMVRPYLDRALAGETVRFRSRIPSPRFGLRDLAVAYVPQFGDGRRVESVVALVDDVTDEVAAEQRLRESEERLQLAMEGARMGTWFRDSAMGHVIWDRQHFRLLGLDPDAVMKPTDELWLARVHPADRDYVVNTLRSARAGLRTFDMQFRIVRADDGEERWMSIHGRYMRSEEGTPSVRSIGIVFDVTDQKRAEIDLRRSEAALREADKRKDEFLATLAHELRNPLAPIRYAARLLRSESSPQVLAQSRETIERQATHMARLLDDLLDVSRITRGAIELRRRAVDLRQAVEDSVEVARPLIDGMQHRLALDLPSSPVWINADPTRLAQIIGNLLQNAAKYTDPGGRIAVRVEANGTEAALHVSDTGIGLSPETRANVFELFSQVHRSITNSRGGLGIGLAIVKRLVELHGGAIDVHSAGLGRGAEFVVRLPRASLAALPTEAPRTPLTAGPNCRVLVVDDNVDSAESLAMLLRMAGHVVQVAHDGAGAIALAEAARPEIVVLDLGMPGVSGFDVARWLRRQPWGATLRLIALTGWGQDEDRRRSREAGFDHHLTKPVDPDELIALLDCDEPEVQKTAGR